MFIENFYIVDEIEIFVGVIVEFYFCFECKVRKVFEGFGFKCV